MPYCNALCGYLGRGVEPAVGLFNVDLVAQNLLIWEGPAEVVNEVEEPGQCVSIGYSWHAGNVNSLIHGAATPYNA